MDETEGTDDGKTHGRRMAHFLFYLSIFVRLGYTTHIKLPLVLVCVYMSPPPKERDRTVRTRVAMCFAGEDIFRVEVVRVCGDVGEAAA